MSVARRLTLGLALGPIPRVARRVGRAGRWLTGEWRPPAFAIGATAIVVWLAATIGKVPERHRVIRWSESAILASLSVFLAVLILRWAWQIRRRVVVGEFSDHRPSNREVVAPGLSTLLVAELLRLRDLYRMVDRQPIAPDQPIMVTMTGTGRAIEATTKVEDFNQFTAVSAEAKVRVGPIDIPVGLVMAVFGRLVQGPRISASVHPGPIGPVLIAQIFGAGEAGSWRVDATAPLRRGGGDSRSLDDMITELACRIFTDVALRTANWRATFTFSRGLRSYRNRLNSRRERTLKLRRAEQYFIDTVAEDESADLAHYAYYNLGLVYTELGQFEAAERAFSSAIDAIPGRPDAYYGLAWIRATLGQNAFRRADYPKATDLYGSVKQLCRRLLELGRESALKARAYDLLATAIEVNASCRERAATISTNADMPTPSSDWTRRAVETRLRAVSCACRSLARSELSGKGVAEARALAATCLRNLAVGYTDHGLRKVRFARWRAFGSAEAALKKALRLAPANPDLLLELSRVYASWGRLEEAERAYESATHGTTGTPFEPKPISPDPQSFSGHIRAIGELRKRKQYFDALAEARLAIQADPLSPDGYRELAEVYAALDDVQRELAAWEDTLNWLPNDAQTHWRIGLCHWKLANDARDAAARRKARRTAADYFDKALALAEDPVIHYWIGRLDLDLGEYADAIAHFRIVHAEGSARLNVNLLLGLAYLRSKAYNQSERHFLEVIADCRRDLEKGRSRTVGKAVDDPHSLREILAWAHWGLCLSYAERDVKLETALALIRSTHADVKIMKDQARRDAARAACKDCEGWVLHKLGRFDDAITALNESLELVADSETYLHLAHAYTSKSFSSANGHEAGACAERVERYCRLARDLDIDERWSEPAAELLSVLKTRLREAHNSRQQGDAPPIQNADPAGRTNQPHRP